MQIFKIDKANQTVDQASEVSGDGMSGVAVQFFGPWGVAYRPKKGELSYSFAVDGDESNSAHIAPQPKIDIQLEEGESAFGNFEAGCYMIFRNNKTIETFGDVKHTGTQETSGIVRSLTDVISASISGRHHTHPQNSGNHFGGGANTSEPN